VTSIIEDGDVVWSVLSTQMRKIWRGRHMHGGAKDLQPNRYLGHIGTHNSHVYVLFRVTDATQKDMDDVFMLMKGAFALEDVKDEEFWDEPSLWQDSMTFAGHVAPQPNPKTQNPTPIGGTSAFGQSMGTSMKATNSPMLGPAALRKVAKVLSDCTFHSLCNALRLDPADFSQNVRTHFPERLHMLVEHQFCKSELTVDVVREVEKQRSWGEVHSGDSIWDEANDRLDKILGYFYKFPSGRAGQNSPLLVCMSLGVVFQEVDKLEDGRVVPHYEEVIGIEGLKHSSYSMVLLEETVKDQVMLTKNVRHVGSDSETVVCAEEYDVYGVGGAMGKSITISYPTSLNKAWLEKGVQHVETQQVPIHRNPKEGVIALGQHVFDTLQENPGQALPFIAMHFRGRATSTILYPALPAHFPKDKVITRDMTHKVEVAYQQHLVQRTSSSLARLQHTLQDVMDVPNDLHENMSKASNGLRLEIIFPCKALRGVLSLKGVMKKATHEMALRSELVNPMHDLGRVMTEPFWAHINLFSKGWGALIMSKAERFQRIGEATLLELVSIPLAFTYMLNTSNWGIMTRTDLLKTMRISLKDLGVLEVPLKFLRRVVDAPSQERAGVDDERLDILKWMIKSVIRTAHPYPYFRLPGLFGYPTGWTPERIMPAAFNAIVEWLFTEDRGAMRREFEGQFYVVAGSLRNTRPLFTPILEMWCVECYARCKVGTTFTLEVGEERGGVHPPVALSTIVKKMTFHWIEDGGTAMRGGNEGGRIMEFITPHGLWDASNSVVMRETMRQVCRILEVDHKEILIAEEHSTHLIMAKAIVRSLRRNVYGDSRRLGELMLAQRLMHEVWKCYSTACGGDEEEANRLMTYDLAICMHGVKCFPIPGRHFGRGTGPLVMHLCVDDYPFRSLQHQQVLEETMPSKEMWEWVCAKECNVGASREHLETLYTAMIQDFSSYASLVSHLVIMTLECRYPKVCKVQVEVLEEEDEEQEEDPMEEDGQDLMNSPMR
jgi:hypothetical protein